MEKENIYLEGRFVKGAGNPGSINRCLLDLGADYDDVYRPSGGSLLRNRQTIYDRYTRGELLAWVERLYTECKKRFHPDRHLRDKEYWTEQFKQKQLAYDKAQTILTKKKPDAVRGRPKQLTVGLEKIIVDLANEGMTQTEIGDEVGLSQRSISTVLSKYRSVKYEIEGR